MAPGLERAVETDKGWYGFGVARCRWRVQQASPEGCASYKWLHPAADQRASNIVGYLEYVVDEVYPFDEIMFFQHEMCKDAARTLGEVFSAFPLGDEGGTVATTMNATELGSTFVLSEYVVSAMLAGRVTVVKSIAMKQALRYVDMVPTFPPRYVVRHYWKQWGRAAQLQEPEELVAETEEARQIREAFTRTARKRSAWVSVEQLRKPTKKTKYDPIKLLRATQCQHFLRGEHMFVESINACRRYDADPSDDDVRVDTKKDHPSRSLRCNSRHRADVTIMLMQRREWEGWYEADAVRSLCVFTDASPVTGIELQGQIVDVTLYNGDIHRRILPGCMLHYGLADATAKGVSLLWGFFLVFGPEKDKLRYACSKVVSYTTDNGVEVNVIKTPNLLNAFYAWLGGAPIAELRDQVVQGSRLAPNAIRVIGIGHTMGNIMYHTCSSQGTWPSRLEKLRVLISHFGNESYRNHLMTVLKGKTDTRVVGALERFVHQVEVRNPRNDNFCAVPVKGDLRKVHAA